MDIVVKHVSNISLDNEVVFLSKSVIELSIFPMYFASHMRLIIHHMMKHSFHINDCKVDLPIPAKNSYLLNHSFAHICDYCGLAAAARVFMMKDILGCCYDDYDLCVQQVLSWYFGLLWKQSYDFALHRLFDRLRARFFILTIELGIPYFLMSKLQYLLIILGLLYWPLLQILIPF